MRLLVGSNNRTKISSVQQVVGQYDFLKAATVHAASVNSGVSKQPRSIEETVQGAVNRAKEAFRILEG